VAAETLVWISGATAGIGQGLARTCPYPGAEIINLSRREHPDVATVRLDLTERSTLDDVGRHFADRLADFRGQRAIFVHNAFHFVDRSFAGEGDVHEHEQELLANGVGSIVLGDLFLHAARPAVEAGVDVGLVMMSSVAAEDAHPGLAMYSAAKAAVEQWVRVVRVELAYRGRGPWVVAARPGLVDTPAAWRDAEQSEHSYPNAPWIASALASGEGVIDVDTMGRDIWAALPPPDNTAVLVFE
jgi:benzil reductase ((S)-benzoin forming)